jgi:hypothetical protein
MRRFGVLLVLLAACATTHGPKVTTGPKVRAGDRVQQVVAQSVAVYDRGGVVLPVPSDSLGIENIGGTLKQVNPDGTTSTIGGGGGTVTADAPLTGNGSSGSHLAMPAATSSTSGYMGASDKALSDQVRGGWEVSQDTFMIGLIPALNQCRSFRPGTPPAIGAGGTAPSSDGAIEGGGRLATDITGQNYIFWSIFQHPKTGKWAITWRGALLGGGASGHVVVLGLYNSAHSHGWTVQRSTTFATHYGISLIGTSTDNSGVGTSTADSNLHNFTLAYDGTAGTPTASMYVDHVLDASTTVVAQMADEPLFPTFFSQVTSEVTLTDVAYCFAATP